MESPSAYKPIGFFSSNDPFSNERNFDLDDFKRGLIPKYFKRFKINFIWKFDILSLSSNHLSEVSRKKNEFRLPIPLANHSYIAAHTAMKLQLQTHTK